MSQKNLSTLFHKGIWIFLGIALLVFPLTAGAEEPGLIGTRWQMVRFQSGDGSVLYPEDPKEFTLEFGGDGDAYFQLQINRASGSWISTDDGRLVFGMLRMTMAAFTPSPFLDRWLKDIDFVRSYLIRDGKLFLALKYDSGVYELEPIE